jgi:hypothetical protein
VSVEVDGAAVDMLAAARRAAAARVADAIAVRVSGRWNAMGERELRDELLVPAIEGTLRAGQIAVAARASSWVDESARQARSARREARSAAGAGVWLLPAAFAGAAADGRPLATLLRSPFITARQALDNGRSLRDARRAGEAQLQRLARTEVGNTARLADGLAIAAHPAVIGYARKVSLPACGRCIQLAGRVYPRSADFRRHPQCNCGHRPVFDGEEPVFPDPDDLFSYLSHAEQDAAFTKAGADAIRAGADISQVVNVTTRRAGLYGPGDRFTFEGTTRRGLAGHRLAEKARARAAATGNWDASGFGVAEGRTRRVATQRRMTPAAILREYGSNPGRLAEALVANGYAAERETVRSRTAFTPALAYPA